jgi:indolepyruvate ferredoxin oxidoreductase beta subunit
MNIYLAGVGGQGIGLLSELLLRAADHAGLNVIGVDTHGLAQRGGIVISQIKFDESVYSPLIGENQADLVVALERHEALRATTGFLKNGGTLIYYNTVWQPLEVRLNQADEISEEILLQHCRDCDIKIISVFNADLASARMQNIVLLAAICRKELLPGVRKKHYQAAMEDLMEGTLLDKNMAVFNKESAC